MSCPLATGDPGKLQCSSEVERADDTDLSSHLKTETPEYQAG